MSDQTRWRKSSYSGDQGNCVEVDDPRWHKSSYSGDQGDCVELADIGDEILVRDSKDPNGPVLHFTSAEWDAFLAGAKDGEFDRTA